MMMRFLDKAFGWLVLLFVLAIIGFASAAAQASFGDLAAYLVFFGLVAGAGVAVAFHYDKALGRAILAIPVGLLILAGVALGAAVTLAAVLYLGWSLTQFLEQYGILGAVFMMLVVIAYQLGMLIDKRRP